MRKLNYRKSETLTRSTSIQLNFISTLIKNGNISKILRDRRVFKDLKRDLHDRICRFLYSTYMEERRIQFKKSTHKLFARRSASLHKLNYREKKNWQHLQRRSYLILSILIRNKIIPVRKLHDRWCCIWSAILHIWRGKYIQKRMYDKRELN